MSVLLMYKKLIRQTINVSNISINKIYVAYLEFNIKNTILESSKF